MKTLFRLALALSFLPTPVLAQQGPPVPLDSLRFLLGEWIAGDDGAGSGGSGDFSFRFDLDGKILVRKNHAEYPATKNRPAVIHDDLMIVYADRTGGTKSSYFDNEGHVIQYTAGLSADGRILTFISDPVPSSPRYRLVYERAPGERLNIRFDIAPPGTPDAFAPYLAGTAHKK